MWYAVLRALGPIPPRITHLVSIVGACVLCFFYCGFIIGQTRRGTVGTKAMEAIKANFVAIVVTSVMATFVVFLRNTENGAVLAMPSANTPLTSVMRTDVMSAIIITRNALCATFGTKPRRKALFYSIGKSASIAKEITLYHYVYSL